MVSRNDAMAVLDGREKTSHTALPQVKGLKVWWARQDSNLQPRDYESPAPPLSYGPVWVFEWITSRYSERADRP